MRTPALKKSRVRQQVWAAARKRRLLSYGDHILVALSGGPDSVALLSILSELASPHRLTLSAAHLNYGLRGEESEEDGRFVAALCRRMNIPLLTERVAPERLRRAGRSFQETARDVRYEVLNRLATAAGSTKVALGHTADDQAETILMWMLRGAGVSGMAGIPATREPWFIRPLLGLTRAEILEYLAAHDIPYRLDSSNETDLYLRNRVRHHLLPVFRQLNPAITQVLARQADIMMEEEQWLEELTATHVQALSRSESPNEVILDLRGLVGLPVALQRRVVRTLLRTLTGRNPSYVAITSLLEKVVHGRSGAALDLRSARVGRRYDEIVIQAGLRSDEYEGTNAEELVLPVPGAVRWPGTGQWLEAHVEASSGDPAEKPGRHRVILDADRVTRPLRVRVWRPGDRFRPAGMRGTVKLQDYFSNMKLPREKRGKVPLVVSSDGIVWVGGHRADGRMLVTGQTTRRLVLELLDGGSRKG